MSTPSTSQRNWGQALSAASWARQSYSLRQVVAQLAHVLDVGAVVPAGVGDSVGPTGAVEALAEVVEDAVGDIDAEGSWRHGEDYREGYWLLAIGYWWGRGDGVNQRGLLVG